MNEGLLARAEKYAGEYAPQDDGKSTSARIGFRAGFLKAKAMSVVYTQLDDKVEWAPSMTVHQVEKWAILSALRYYNGHRTKAAAAVGISIRTLRNKLVQYRKEDDWLGLQEGARRQVNDPTVKRRKD